MGCARGAPPQWVRTAAASEAWALLQVLRLSMTMHNRIPNMVTDCNSLLTVASGAARRATGPKQPLARIWGQIAATVDNDLRTLGVNDKLRWVPAHLGESAVGFVRPCGRVFTATDWRANRLADALAKNVSRHYAIDETDANLVVSAEHTAEHALALLGVVTHAANHRSTSEIGKDGISRIVFKRDSIDERPKRTKVTPAKSKPPPCSWDKCELPEVDTETTV